MIVLGIIAVVEQVFGAILGVLPSFTPPDLGSMATSFMGSSFWSYLGWFNAYAPLSEIAFCLSAIATVFAAIWIVKLVVFLLSKFHLLGAGE